MRVKVLMCSRGADQLVVAMKFLLWKLSEGAELSEVRIDQPVKRQDSMSMEQPHEIISQDFSGWIIRAV